jgi:hypothetical protein
VNAVIRKQQGGFRKHRCCVDQINILRIILEQNAGWNTQLYLMLVNFEKVFDTADRNKLWNNLEIYRIQGKILNLIKEFSKLYAQCSKI